jgi:hypothetical protein
LRANEFGIFFRDDGGQKGYRHRLTEKEILTVSWVQGQSWLMSQKPATFPRQKPAKNFFPPYPLCAIRAIMTRNSS